jgi:multidrug efflux system membrane fusion protein
LRWTPLLVLALAGLLPGCEQRPPEAAAEATVVTVSQPLEREVTDSATFIGETEAIESVDVYARVSGYLQKVAFQHGDEVKKGQLLFEIDPTVYAADLDRAKGTVVRDQAAVERLDAEYRRTSNLLQGRAASREDYEKALAQRDESKAILESDKASVKVAQQNLDWTRVVAPSAARSAAPSSRRATWSRPTRRC